MFSDIVYKLSNNIGTPIKNDSHIAKPMIVLSLFI